MKTVRLYFKRTNDIMLRNNFWSLDDRESDRCWISETADFVLPEKIELRESFSGDLRFYLVDGNPADFGVIETRPNGEPRLVFMWTCFNLDRVDALKEV